MIYFLLQVALTAGLTFIAEQFLPWWSIALCSGIASLLLGRYAWRAFFGGFTGISFLWMGKAAWIDYCTNSILSQKLVPLFHLPNVTALILLTGLVGGLIGGLSALTGYFIKR